MAEHRLVVGLDGSPGAAAALDWAVRYASEVGADVIAVHVLGATPEYVEQRQRARDALREWATPLREQGVEHRTEVVDGSPASALDKVASREDADLIVVGRRGREGFAELLLGSVPHALAHHAHRPVVIVPAPAG
jgi:nucleotide-binding universal stress UspA family protein